MNNYHNFISKCMIELSKEKRVLDVGGGERFQKWLKEYEHLFSNSNYQTFDYDSKSGADIIGDIHKMPIETGTIDAIICHSVLEHVWDPIRAVEELYRILRPGGKIFVHVPSTYPYHARKGHYPDYWRFFDDTLHELFKDFSKVELIKRGGYFKALFFFVPMQYKLQFLLNPIANFLDKLFKMEKRNTTSGYYIYAIK
ncbi:MAG: class I SAM-dependent methyltransferase [Candidatus Zambryskibacteria bacterium]|nr:class I SAM-dependent methyltransferase [Candidatus Zambryskibacteria bacterium]